LSVVGTTNLVDRSRRKQVIGACVVSAAGSLPLHLMSFMVALSVIDGLMPVDHAGWISSCFFVGLLASTVALPMLGFKRVTVFWPLAGVLVVVAALWAGVAHGTVFLLGGWISVGMVCGVLHFLGSTSAASYPDRHFVFGLRLALVLFAAAAVIGGAGLAGGFGSYADAATVLSVGFTFACLIGLLWYRPPPAQSLGMPQTLAVPMRGSERWFGLAVAVLFYAGQPGFAAYATHLALSHGIGAAGLPAVYAGCKAVGAIVLLRWGANARSGVPTLKLGAVLGVAILSMALAHDLAVFTFGLLLWEIAVNVQSTRLQATVVSQSPSHGGLWLPAAVAMGAGLGPVVYGALLGRAAGHWFVAFSVLSGLLPAAWIVHRTRTLVAPGSCS
jgi:hypothetical protein